jgi:alpha-ketoglutarate-dependent taurine dioxygenase
MFSFDLDQLSTPDGAGCACILNNRDDGDPMRLDREEVIRLFKLHGAILFRGFTFGDEEGFRRFTERFGKDFFIHPSVNRQMVGGDDTVQTVDYGAEPITLHGEFSYLPFPLRPEMGWFYCVRPTRRGGQTTICDGTQIAPRLSVEARELLESRRLRFRMKFPDVIWQRFFQTGSVEEVLEFLRRHSIEEPFTMKDRILYLDHIAPGLKAPRFSDQVAFVNNTIFYHDRGEKMMAVFEEGDPLSDSLVAELARVADSLTAEVSWQEQDLLMFDNTRMLHGRRRLLDEERIIYTRWCHASF